MTVTLEDVAQQVRRGGAVALTGAGVSVASGIPDFRSPGGLWERFDPMEYGFIGTFMKDPAKVWEMLREVQALLLDAQPNPAHTALAELEAAGFLAGVVTQNVDALHQRAGSRTVVEYHGGGDRLVCLQCDARYPPERALASPLPRCEVCPDSVLKPDVVLFGEMIPSRAVEAADKLVEEARTILVCGTSAEVYPAAELPLRAQARGIPVYEFNLSSTVLTGVATGTIFGPVAETLPALVQAVERLTPS